MKTLLILATLLCVSPALAQTPPAKRFVPTGDLQGDLQRARSDPATPAGASDAGAKIFAVLAKPFQDLADFIAGDIEAAANLAVEIPELQDTNGQACWTAMGAAGKVFKAHPVPVTFRAATDIQALRLLILTTNKLCANPACTIVFSDLANVAQTASPLPLPIPSISQLCSKIAQLAPMLPASALPASALPASALPASALPVAPASKPATP